MITFNFIVYIEISSLDHFEFLTVPDLGTSDEAIITYYNKSYLDVPELVLC